MISTYPSHPGSKVPGPSREAANAVRGRCEMLREMVGDILKFSERTADECAEQLGESILSIRPRLSELVKMGRIEDTGIRRKNASGHSAAVWRSRRTYAQKELL